MCPNMKFSVLFQLPRHATGWAGACFTGWGGRAWLMSRSPGNTGKSRAVRAPARRHFQVGQGGRNPLFLACALLLASSAFAAERHDHRDRDRVRFMLTTPCPSTGEVEKPCPGYEIDHPLPLCAGGSHSRENMRWLRKEEAREKARRDMEMCRRMRQKGG